MTVDFQYSIHSIILHQNKSTTILQKQLKKMDLIKQEERFWHVFAIKPDTDIFCEYKIMETIINTFNVISNDVSQYLIMVIILNCFLN